MREGNTASRIDLPTLPLKLRQTPGGYKAIEDAEDRLVTFVGMREDDRAWGEFLIGPINKTVELRAIRERHKAKAVACNFSDCGCDYCEAVAPFADVKDANQ